MTTSQRNNLTAYATDTQAMWTPAYADLFAAHVNEATALAADWDWDVEYLADDHVTDFMLQSAGFWNWDIYQAYQ